MEKLNLPPIKFKTPDAKKLTMDEYLKFVYFNLKYTLKKGAVRKRKKIEAIKVPFSL